MEVERLKDKSPSRDRERLDYGRREYERKNNFKPNETRPRDEIANNREEHSLKVEEPRTQRDIINRYRTSRKRAQVNKMENSSDSE